MCTRFAKSVVFLPSRVWVAATSYDEQESQELEVLVVCMVAKDKAEKTYFAQETLALQAPPFVEYI